MSDTLRLQLQQLLAAGDAEYSASLAAGAADANDGATAPDQAGLRLGRGKDRHTVLIEQLGTILKTAINTETTEELTDQLHELETTRENDIKAICESEENPFMAVVAQLDQVRGRAHEIKKTVAIVGQQMERSSNQLIDRASRHVYMNRTRVNIENSLEIVRLCLQALEHTNQVQELLKSSHRVAAVQNLQDLQSMELDQLRHIGMGALISQSVPGLTKEITNTTLVSLNGYLSKTALDSHVTDVGNRAYGLLQKQRRAWDLKVSQHRHLRPFRFNSPVELAYRRSGALFLTESQLHVDLGLLCEANMVFEKLGRSDELRSFVKNKLNTYSDSLAVSGLDRMLETLPKIVGFCLFDRTLSRNLPTIRPNKMVDDNWERLAQNISGVVGSSMRQLDDFRPLKKQLSMLSDTLHNFEFNTASISDLFRRLLTRLGEKIVEKSRQDFLSLWKSGDQMQMVITTQESFDSIMSVVWYDPREYEETRAESVSHGEQVLPRAMPFSEIYVRTCRDIRALIDHSSSFLDHFQQDPGFVENTLASLADSLLKNPVLSTLSQVSKGNNRELIVQTLINLQLFHRAALETEKILAQMRGATGRRGTVALEVTPLLEKAAKDAETRIYVLLEETVAEFFESSDFNWLATEPADTPSPMVLEMTTYLLTMANTILKRLPPEVRYLAYFNMAENINTGLRNSLYTAPKGITSAALANYAMDVSFLEDSVSQLETNSSPSMALLEVKQIVDLLRSQDPSGEYANLQVRMRKYDRLTPSQAQELIGKLASTVTDEQIPRSPDTSSLTSPKLSQSGFMRYLSGGEK